MFIGAPIKNGEINSNPIQTKVGANKTNVFTATSTKVTQGTDGKVNGGETTLYYSNTPDNYIPSAITKDGGKTWKYLNYKQGDNIPAGKKVGDSILGADAKKSLEQGALRNNTAFQITKSADNASIPKEQQKKLAASQQNKAGNVGAGTSQQNSLATDEKINAELIGAAARGSYGDVQYPEKLNLTHQDYMKFTMLEYVARGLGGGSGVISSTDNARVKGQRKTLGSVTLPIPAGIGDSNQVNWASDEIKPEDTFLSSIASDTIQQGAKGLGSNLENAANTAKNKTGEVQGIVEDRVTQAITGISILQRKFGAITNNNIELLFQGPGLRSFGFTFKLTPRNERETENVKKILRFFKQGMTPKRSKGELYLKSPNTFTIGYYHGKELNPYLNKIKECAMTSFNVNYTPEGNYATFADGSMISYEIQMQFQELEPIFDSDYGNDYKDIGF